MDLFSSSFWIILAAFQIQTWGAIYSCRYCPPRFKLKIGSKEPKNRLKLIPLTVSKIYKKILIVKTSSLGDIVQSFVILDDLHQRFPEAEIDWVVESSSYCIVKAHPLIKRAISLEIKKPKMFWKSIHALRKEKYDLIFDLQGNCKSGLITFLARGDVKVGYALGSVREWPNILATHIRFHVSKEKNIRLFYLELIEKFFGTPSTLNQKGIRFKIEEEEKKKIERILQGSSSMRIMVCPGSKWPAKQLTQKTLVEFLQNFKDAHLFFVWGDPLEKVFCEKVAQELPHSKVVEKLSIPTWQNLMCEMDLIIAVDSSALHLCATTATASFSIFGPTRAEVFRPIGGAHIAFQGKCPYHRSFKKQCPVLRSCPTGACMKSLTAEELFQAYQNRCDSPPP